MIMKLVEGEAEDAYSFERGSGVCVYYILKLVEGEAEDACASR